MKKYFLFVLLFAFYLSVHAQQANWDEEQIKSYKVAFITKRLNLSVKESQQFWPVYNEYDAKRDKISKKKQLILQNIRLNRANMSDDEIEKLIDEHVELSKEDALLLEEYHAKFKKVLPIKKVVLLYIAENQFKMELVRRLRQNQAKNRMNGSF